MTGELHAGRPSGDDKRACARERLHIYQVACPTCRARHWFALPLESPEQAVREEQKRWREHMQQDCAQGKHEGMEKVSSPV